MVNPKMPSEWTISLGEGAELLADKYSISRDEQDAFALASHVNAAAAWDAGWFDAEVVPAAGADLARDECIRADTSPSQVGLAGGGVPVVGHGDGGELVTDERWRVRPDPRLRGGCGTVRCAARWHG